MCVYADECVGRVHEWERTCPPAGHSGVGHPGSSSRAATTATAQPGTASCADLWGQGVATLRILTYPWEDACRAPTPRCSDMPLCPPPPQSCTYPAASSSQNPGTAVLTAEGAVVSLTPGTMGTVNRKNLTEEAVVWLSSHKLQGQLETAGGVLAAEIVWCEQAGLKLKITGGSGESTPPPLCAIVLLWDSSQCHLGEIQRENLSNMVRGSSRLWPALTKRGFCAFRAGGAVGQRVPQGSALQCGGHTETLSKEKVRRDSRLSRHPVLLCMCVHAQPLCKQRTQRDRVMLKGLWDPIQHGWQSEDCAEWKVWA